MAAGGGGAPGSGGTQDTRVARIEEGVAGLQTENAENSLYDANWPNYPMTPASLTTNTGVANGELVYTASGYYGGTLGNSITVQYVVSGNSTPLSVSVNGYNVVVHVATNGGGTGTSTAAQIAAAVNGATNVQGAGGYISTGVQQLVVATNKVGNNGSGVITANYGPASLSGGTGAQFTTFDQGRASNVEPARQVAQVDTQWENNGITPWDALKLADPTKW